MVNYNPTFTINHDLVGDQLHLITSYSFNNHTEILSREVIDLKEQIIKDSLVKLGWTPPKGDN